MAYFLFDVETTGLDCNHHEMCSLAAVILDDNFNFKAKGHMNLMPDHWDRAEKRALEINGVDPKTWKATHSSNAESVDKMVAFVDKNTKKKEKVIPMGHNVKFDIGFLKALFKKTGQPWRFYDRREVDTMQLMDFWRITTGEDIRDFRLGACCKHFGIETPNAHNASADAIATMRLAQTIIADLKNRIKSGIKGIV